MNVNIFRYPHVVVWENYGEWSDAKQDIFAHWIEQNVRSDFVFISGKNVTLGGRQDKTTETEEKFSNVIIVAFESQDEAIHFKLTWC